MSIFKFKEKSNYYLIFIVMFSVTLAKSQTTIFTNVAGASYTNIDNVATDSYNGINVSNCTSLRLSVNFSFSVPWDMNTSGNDMEPPEACNFTGLGCIPDVNNSNSGDCINCWDFMYIELILDGVVVSTELIGGVGENRQSGTITKIVCTNNAASAEIRIRNQNWAASETNSFSNVILECWEGKPTISSNTACVNENIVLTGMVGNPADVMSWAWTGSGTGTILNPLNSMTTVTGATSGDTYTLTVTDDNGCTASSAISVSLMPLQNPNFAFGTFCVGAPNGPVGIITSGGTFTFNPIPGDGATINGSTGVISNGVSGTAYGVQYTTPGPCPASTVVMVQVTAGQDPTFIFNDFCQGLTNGPTGIVTPGGTFSFNPNPGGGVTINPTTGVISGEMGGNSYTVQYTTAGPCASSTTVLVNVTTQITPVLGPLASPYCTSAAAATLPTTQSGINGNWTGPGVSANQFLASNAGPGFHTLTFTPLAGQCASTNTIQVEVIANPMGNLVGNPILCPGQCGQVMFQFLGGSGTFNINMNISAGAFNFNFPMIGVNNSTVLNICYANGNIFDVATNTLNIPTFVPPGTYSLTLLNFDSTPAGSCTSGIVGFPGSLSVTINPSPTVVPTSMVLCDEDQNGTELFDLTTLENTVKNNVFANTVSWFTDMAATNPILNPNGYLAASGAVVYALVSTPTGCMNVAPVTLTLNQPVNINTNDFSICVNDPAYNLPGLVNGFSGNWSGANVSSNQFDPTGLAAGTYAITFMPFVGQCALPATANVVITDAGPVPLANPISTACLASGQVTLNTQQNGVNGTWSGSPFLTGNIFDVTSAGVGSYTLTFTPSGAISCLSPNTTQLVVIGNTTLAPVTFGNVCVGGSNVNLGNMIDGNLGTWSGNAQVNLNNFDPNTSAGIYNLVFSPNDVCVIGFATTIEVTEPTVLIAPSFGTTCVNGSLINLPSTVDGFAGVWSYNSSPITSFLPSTYGQGTFNLVFTPNVGLCASPTNTNIVINQISAGQDASFIYCTSGNQTVDLNTLLTLGSTTGGTWTLLGNPVLNASTFNLSNLSDGANVFSYIINDALCGRDTALITYNVSAPNNAGLSSMQTLCTSNSQGVNFNSFLGTVDAGGTWTQSMGTAVDLSNLSNVNLSALGGGTFVFTYIIAEDACLADTSMTSITLVPFNNAGADDISTACLGSNIDLLSLINTSFTGGTFLNPNGYAGLVGSMWNTSTLSAGNYIFNYATTSQAPCLSDTASITINLAATVTAGNDIIGSFCEGNSLNLGDFISPNASAGGSFYQNNILIAANGFNPGNATNFVFTYVVGDGVTCPRDTAIVTLARVDKPIIPSLVMLDICENKCVDLMINHGSSAGSTAYLTISSNSGQNYNYTQNILNSNPFTINICAKKTGPFDFVNIPVNQTFTLKVDSLKVLSGGCKFTYANSVSFKTLASPARTISKSLCSGDILQVGSDIYSITKPTGVTLIPSTNSSQCDSVITVNLTFNAASPQTDVNMSTCDQNFSLQVGPTVFNKANPSGQVTLKNKFGCDSLVNVSLVFSAFSSGAFSFTTCDSAFVYTVGGQNFGVSRQTGTATIVGGSVAGCDSVVTVKLKYLAKPSSVLSFQSCDPTYKLTLGGVTFDKAKPNGQANLIGQASNGCDSIVNVNIAYLSVVSSNYTFSTCDDKYSYKVGTNTFNKSNPSGTAVLQNSAVNGCDSIVNVQLNFSDFTFLNEIAYACDGSDAILNIALASHPGPYQIKVDQAPILLNQILPYSTSLKPGAHVISLLTSEGCRDTIAVNVNSNSGPTVDLSQFALSNGQFQLNVDALPNAIYGLMWSPSASLTCSDCTNPIANPNETTTYTLDFLYGNDCNDSRSIIVEKVNSEVILPNIFSPNRDGSNDIFYVQFPDKTKGIIKQFQVYDRWGNLMFNKQDLQPNTPDNGWDGTYKGAFVQPGVFVYYIEIQFEGVTEIKKYSGSITLIK